MKKIPVLPLFSQKKTKLVIIAKPESGSPTIQFKRTKLNQTKTER